MGKIEAIKPHYVTYADAAPHYGRRLSGIDLKALADGRIHHVKSGSVYMALEISPPSVVIREVAGEFSDKCDVVIDAAIAHARIYRVPYIELVASRPAVARLALAHGFYFYDTNRSGKRIYRRKV
jgi:hypothetical protein